MAGGMELAAGATCPSPARGALRLPRAALGCAPVDGGTYRLPRIVGLGRALDLILTGRELGAAEAERMGFVDRLVPDGTALDAAVELAEGIAAVPWACVVSDRRAGTTAWASAWPRRSPTRTASAAR